MQLVFLSNELQPVFMQDSDRRYMVIRTPTRKSLDYYAAIEEELQADGAAALYQYLLDLDLGDFTAHAKPLETDARSDLIELGRPSAQQFFCEIRDGLVPLPFTPALVRDAYN